MDLYILKMVRLLDKENRDSFSQDLYFMENRNDITAVPTRFLQNAAYLRLKQLTFSYTIPESLSRKISIERLRIYLSGNNFMTRTKMTDIIDPELTGASRYPLSKPYH
jgi:hypothetical protein